MSRKAYLEEFAWDDEHLVSKCGFVCSQCKADVNFEPCPEHAPKEVRGLRLVDCEATPRHWLWTLNREDYGTPCFWCERDEMARREYEAQACKHKPWHRWRVKEWLHHWVLHPLKLTTGMSWAHGHGHNGCVTYYWRRWR